jgi:glycine hydroxymethyltransferase
MLGTYRRYSNPRFYKGVEYVDVVEALARRRCAEVFAANNLTADDLFVNVQPLSGAPANNAVIHSLSVTRRYHPWHEFAARRASHPRFFRQPVGHFYNAQHYAVDPETELLNYDAILEKAWMSDQRSSSPAIPAIHSCQIGKNSAKLPIVSGALLLTDISHIAGLIAAGVVPSPVGFAHIITFTTHKSLLGPRGACIITDNPAFAKKIDKGIFPGEQGGPHINTIASMALTFKLAQTETFKAASPGPQERGCICRSTSKTRTCASRIKAQTPTSFCWIVNLSKSKDGIYLSGDMGARIFDIAGIVANYNTIPGDRSTFSASGIRFGSHWLTQRGLGEKDFREIADIIADLFAGTTPYNMPGRKSPQKRAKVDFMVLEDAKQRVNALAEKADALIDLHKSFMVIRISSVLMTMLMLIGLISNSPVIKFGFSSPMYYPVKLIL